MKLTRGFRLWVLFSILWIGGVIGAFLVSERSPIMATKPPAECIKASNAIACARTLEKLRKNPLEAFGYVGSEPLYVAENHKHIKRVTLLALLPPASTFLIGAGFVWALKGFARW